jgi:hypothetical protein
MFGGSCSINGGYRIANKRHYLKSKSKSLKSLKRLKKRTKRLKKRGGGYGSNGSSIKPIKIRGGSRK